MMTVKEVSSLTGVSVRTLQFYDETGLFKPTKLTDAGYRLYDDVALETLQQILFFKELDFTLKEIKTIMENPQFDRTAAFKKQRELIQLKRDRLDNLLKLLNKLIKGEKCMDFNDFDMSDYFRILTDFKKTHTNEIIKQFGNMESFDEMVSELKLSKDKIAPIAISQYDSIENFTIAMENNLKEFLSNGPAFSQQEAMDITQKTEALTKELTTDINRDTESSEVQETIGKLIELVDECNKNINMGENYWLQTAEAYMSNPLYVAANDKKYGDGASEFIGKAIKAYLRFKS